MKKIRRIEIYFPVKIELPAGFENALCALVDMACVKWESENPTMVMWAAGISAGDEQLEFDETVLAIEICAREDYHGENPANPDRERLRAEAAERRKKADQP